MRIIQGPRDEGSGRLTAIAGIQCQPNGDLEPFRKIHPVTRGVSDATTCILHHGWVFINHQGSLQKDCKTGH